MVQDIELIVERVNVDTRKILVEPRGKKRIPGSNGIHRDPLGSTGILWDLSGSIGIHRDLSGSIGIHRDLWDSSGSGIRFPLLQIREAAEKERQKRELEFASTIKRSRNGFTFRDYFYDIDVPDDFQSFDINVALKDNNYFNDSILNYIEHDSNQFSSYPKLNEEEIQKGFDQLIVNLLNTLNNSTSLKYLNTSSSYYLVNHQFI